MTRILPQRITVEHIIGNIDYMRHSGGHIEDRRTSGSINGREYARIVNGIPYRIDN